MDNHGNGREDANDNEQRVKITIATLPYLEKLHNLLIEPPYVSLYGDFCPVYGP